MPSTLALQLCYLTKFTVQFAEYSLGVHSAFTPYSLGIHSAITMFRMQPTTPAVMQFANFIIVEKMIMPQLSLGTLRSICVARFKVFKSISF